MWKARKVGDFLTSSGRPFHKVGARVENVYVGTVILMYSGIPTKGFAHMSEAVIAEFRETEAFYVTARPRTKPCSTPLDTSLQLNEMPFAGGFFFFSG